MARFKEASWRPIPKWNSLRRLRLNPTVLVFHIAVTNGKSLFSFFSRSDHSCSHFYVAKDGFCEQYMESTRKSVADYNGNYRTISVETEGGVGSDLDNGWTDAQLETLAQIAAWAHTTHNIPLRAMKTSRKSEVGVGYHRLGVPGFKVSDGELWSSVNRKVCPGNARIAQVPSIVERAIKIVKDDVVIVLPPVDTEEGIDLSKLPTLRRGDKGIDVARLQGLLMANNFAVGSAGMDGEFGEGTTLGLIAFQHKHPETGSGGKPDGIAGLKVWKVLLGV